MEIILFKCFCCVSVVHSTIINQFNVLIPLVVMIAKLSALWDDQFYSLQDQNYTVLFICFIFGKCKVYTILMENWWRSFTGTWGHPTHLLCSRHFFWKVFLYVLLRILSIFDCRKFKPSNECDILCNILVNIRKSNHSIREN